jgi:ABC-type Mn2+/Zn2+ transport system permease subunit
MSSVLAAPLDWGLAPFLDSVVMQRALLAGLLAVLCTSVIGTWVVLRGMSFLGDALAHGVLPGVALAFLVGWSLSVGAFVAALLMVAAINLLRERSPLPDDTSIGVLFVGFLALAIVVMSSGSAAYVGDLNGILFGSVTGITDSDLVRQAFAALFILIGVVILYRPLLALSFDETQARLLGMNPRLTQAALMVLLVVAIVASFEVVGNLLVFAFLIAPPAAAALTLRRVPWIMFGAVGLGTFAVWLGLILSYHYGSAAGATMALVAVGEFLALVAVRSVRLRSL